MTVNRTTLLDLPLPVTGTESNTWGDITNNGLTEYMDIAIAGMSNLTSANFTAGALTIETTEGNAAGTSISATSAQYAGFRVTSLATNSTITVGNTGTSPARSYRLINADATYNLTFKATGQTGVTLLPGQSAVVAFNGTDYVIVGTVGAGTATDNAVARFDGTTGEILQNSAATIDDTGAATFVGSVNVSGTSASAADLKLYEDTDNGTNYVAFKSPASVASNVTWTLPSADGTNGQALTTNGSGTLAFSSVTTSPGGSTTQVQYNNAGAFAGSSNLTFDGTNLTVGGTATATKLIPTGNVTAGNGMYLPTTNTLAFSTNGSERMRIDSSGNLGLGVTPSAWGSAFKVLQLANGTSLSNNGQTSYYQIGANNYYDGTNYRYIASNYAGFHRFSNAGAYEWHTAPSGTAGNAITFTQAMTLDASGNLNIRAASAGATTSFRIKEDGGTDIAEFSANETTGEVRIGGILTNYFPTFYSSNTERMRIDSSGNVGIGTSSPSQELEVRKDQGSGTLVKVTNKTNNNSATAGVLFENSTSNNASLALWDSGAIAGTVYSDSYGFYLVHSGGPIGIVADNASGVIKFATGGTTERMRITSGGNLLVGTTTNNASGGVIQVSNGITFPATQSASSDANTLDDYEEGTWTPSVGGNATYDNQEGKYTKVGRIVTVSMFLSVNTIGTGSTSTISGLPFQSGDYFSGSIAYWNQAAASYVYMAPLTSSGSSSITFYGATAAASGISALSPIGSGTDFRLTITYFV